MVKKVLVIGLDSAPLALLQPWMEQGHLPNLARLFQTGASGILRSTFPPLSPAAWSSFSTGMLPGKHGVYDHGYRRDGSYKIVPTNSRRRGGKTIWQLVNDHGGRVGIINIPETYPPEAVDGFVITGMATPSDEADWCYPPALKEELAQAMGGYRVFGRRSKENLDLSLAGMHETIPMRMKAAAYLWRTYQPQFMTLVFMESDVVQHKTWKYMDRSHPQYDAAGSQKYGNAILDVYRRIDEHLPLLLDQLDEDTALIVMSDHGAGPIDKWLNLNAWLLQESFLALKPGLASRLRQVLFRAGMTPNNAYKMAAALRLGLVDRTANRAKQLASQANGSVSQASPLLRLFLSFADVDWGRTRAYTLGGNVTGIWVNLRGREPQGCVAPGAEYEQVRDELISRLHALRDPQSGQPIATTIYRREEVYHGPYLERAPDVIFETTDEQYVGFGVQEFVSNRIAEPSPLFSGCHRRDGLILFHGAPFRPGARLEAHDIVDVAPTVLHLLGYPVPADMDGQVVLEAISEEQRQPVRLAGTSWKPASDEAEIFTADEEEAVTERLRDLGYL